MAVCCHAAVLHLALTHATLHTWELRTRAPATVDLRGRLQLCMHSTGSLTLAGARAAGQAVEEASLSNAQCRTRPTRGLATTNLTHSNATPTDAQWQRCDTSSYQAVWSSDGQDRDSLPTPLHLAAVRSRRTATAAVIRRQLCRRHKLAWQRPHSHRPV